MNRSPRIVPVLLSVFILAGILGGCGGGHGGGGGGGINDVIDLNIDASIVGTASGPNITFTDGTSASLGVLVTNIGKLSSDQLVTVTVGLPTGVTFVSFVSTTPGWTCNAAGQTITCTSSASIAGLTGSSTITINVRVASNASGSPRLTVSVSTPDGSPSTNSLSKGVIFNAAATLSITSLMPNSGPVGTSVTIAGSNFGSTQGASTVKFNGTTATPTSWSATSIVASVPTGATTGNVVVTVGGTASSSVTFTVTSTSACASGGNAASLLTGDYAFREQGFLRSSGGFAVDAGRFHADGVNTISNGLLEYNSVTSGNSSNGTPVTFTGCFVLNKPATSSGPALGTMTLVNSAASLSTTIAIAVQADGDGRFIAYDSTSSRGSGYFEKQCPTAAGGSCPAFSDSNISGDYGFGFHGLTTTTATSNAGAVGRLTASGSGGVSAGVIDISTSGGVAALDVSLSSASYTVTDTTNGRATVTFKVTYNGGPNNGSTETFNMACYIADINSGVSDILYCMGLDTPNTALPLLTGRIIVQKTPSGGWTNTNAVPTSLASVEYATGIDGSGTPRTEVGQFSFNSSASTVTINQDVNKGGSTTFQTVTGNYSVAANGRVEFTSSGSLVSVSYLLAPGKGFGVDEANNASVSFFEPQEAEPAGGFTTTNFDNTFAYGTVNPIEEGVSDFDGVFTSAGSTGTMSGTEYLNSTSGISNPGVAATYTILSGDGAIGRVTMTLTSPVADTIVVYIIDANTFVSMSTLSSDPAVIYGVK